MKMYLRNRAALALHRSFSVPTAPLFDILSTGVYFTTSFASHVRLKTPKGTLFSSNYSVLDLITAWLHLINSPVL